MISAVVLTKNEEKNIARCLASLQWCDEIIVIDDYSIDKTVEIAKKANATVYQRSLNGDFARQRNFGLTKAKNDWVLFIDADEVVSKDLADEMYQQTSQFLTRVNGFSVKREDVMWGRTLRFGEVGNIRLVRLARRDKGEWVGKVHEVWQVTGPLSGLKHSLQHYPHRTVAEFLSEVNTYSTLRSQELFAQKRKTNFVEIVAYPKAKFFLNYIVKQGFRDGIPGLIVALMMSFHSFLVRGKLWQLWRKK